MIKISKNSNMYPTIKLIQLNAWKFTHFDEILKFLKQQNPDIINLQEATTGPIAKFNNGMYLEKLAKELKMKIIYFPFTATELDDQKLDWFGNAILTKCEILDYGVQWMRNNDNKPGIITTKMNLNMNKAMKINKNLLYPMVFRQPKNFVWVLLHYNGKIFRSITTHFTATQKCTETLQMIQEATDICDFIDNTKDTPTLFSGDLNIQKNASCISLIESKLNLINKNSINTLNKSIHPIFSPKIQAKDPEIKDGLSIDYVFEKGIKVVNYEIPNVEISDHLPIVVEFEIK